MTLEIIKKINQENQLTAKYSSLVNARNHFGEGGGWNGTCCLISQCTNWKPLLEPYDWLTNLICDYNSSISFAFVFIIIGVFMQMLHKRDVNMCPLLRRVVLQWSTHMCHVHSSQRCMSDCSWCSFLADLNLLLHKCNIKLITLQVSCHITFPCIMLHTILRRLQINKGCRS
jgi:hypothetical protein